MYFNVYSDTGAEIQGYLIPDGFSAQPKICVRANGRNFGPIECDIFLEGPYKHKHHETGVVGFLLNEERIADLRNAVDLEISDGTTGFPFYRRLRPEKHIQKRIFRLETQFAPHGELDSSLKPYFQFYANNVERYGSETVRQMLEIVHQPSTYVSGRVLLKNVQRYFNEDTIKITSLRDPFYELAIRLFTIGSFKKRRFSFLSERDEIFFEPAMAYFNDTNLADEAAIREKIRSAPKEILGLFASPFTHQLMAATPTDKVSRDSVSGALDALSQFTIFNAEETDDSLARDIGEMVGLQLGSLNFAPLRKPFVDIANILRGIQVLEHVLESDLILYYFIRKAGERAAAVAGAP